LLQNGQTSYWYSVTRCPPSAASIGDVTAASIVADTAPTAAKPTSAAVAVAAFRNNPASFFIVDDEDEDAADDDVADEAAARENPDFADAPNARVDASVDASTPRTAGVIIQAPPLDDDDVDVVHERFRTAARAPAVAAVRCRANIPTASLPHRFFTPFAHPPVRSFVRRCSTRVESALCSDDEALASAFQIVTIARRRDRRDARKLPRARESHRGNFCTIETRSRCRR
jgi:hypothetical protein